MSSFTIQASTVIDSVIQDGQVQTTNRTALLDYVNRVSLRILRESQWAFLRSQPQKFITDVGVTKYWVGGGTPPPGYSDTGLQLSNVGTVVPESVFDLTNNHQLAEVSPNILNRASLRFSDGSFRIDRPRNYWFEYDSGGALTLVPPPSGTNQYQPVPLPPACSYIAGGYLPRRTYSVVVTYVDSFYNEGMPCTYSSQISVPANCLLVVSPPMPEVSSSTTVTYGGWNVYVGPSSPFTNGQPNLYQQNTTPLSLTGTFQEPDTGISTVLNPESVITIADPTGVLWNVQVSTSGILSAVMTTSNPQNVFYVKDSSGTVWSMGINTEGQLFAADTGPNFPVPVKPVYLTDSSGNVWNVVATPSGFLETISSGPASNFAVAAPLPPQVSNLTPLQGYVIQFEYMQQRLPITDASQYLQIPFQYQDVVVAGVNYYANLYTAKPDDEGIKAGAWKKEFMDGLAQIRRDLRISSRPVDYLAPDRVSQRSDGVDWNIILYN